MKRFVYKASFIPRVPQTNAPLNRRFTCVGDLFIISETFRQLVDFRIIESQIGAGTRVHIAPPFQAFVTEDQDRMIKAGFNFIFNSLSYNISRAHLDQSNMVILPVIQEPKNTDWDATMAWVVQFVAGSSVLALYNEQCARLDRANQGEKLKSFLHERGSWVNRIIRFVMSIECTISDFIENNPELNDYQLTKGECVGILAALRYQEGLIGRTIRSSCLNAFSATGKIDTHSYVVQGVAYGTFASMQVSGTKTYQTLFEEKYEMPIGLQNPLLEVIPVKTLCSNPYDLYKLLIAFPAAFSREHVRILEILDAKPDILTAIFRRIPEDFDPGPAQHKLLPMEAANYTPFPRMAGVTMHLMNALANQLRPTSLGNQLADDNVISCASMIEKELGYRFKDLMILRRILIDPTYQHCQTEVFGTYQRLEFLGDGVLELCAAFPIFNGMPKAREGLLSAVKTAIVENDTLSKLGKEFGLDKFVLTIRPDNYTSASKNTADLIEALFGGIFLDSSLLTCCEVFQRMAVKFQHVFAEALRHIKKASDAVTHLVNQPASEMAFLELPKRPNKIPIDHSLTLDQVQALLGIELPDPSLLWLFHMALTHKSASNDFNYERLEFIGDVIVKMAVSVYLYASFPLAEESGLSICGNFYKSNDWLGRAAIRMGLARVTVFSEGFRESIDLEPDPDDIHIGLSKVHGDLFESCCAAITMSVGLKKGIEWCREKIFGDRFPNRADNPDLNPKSVCFNRIAQLFKGAPVVFEIWSDSGAFFSYMAVGDYQFPFFEESRDRAKAMALVAEDVLKALDDPDFVKQVEEGLSAE